jgi:TIR domain
MREIDSMASTLPRVFLSYSHDSKSHADQVRHLANELRANGVDAWLDQYELAPEMGWPRWMQQQIDAADFILGIASPTYKRRFEGKESPGTGRGVSWEGLILNQALYDASGRNKKIISIVFDDIDAERSIPTPLRPFFIRAPSRRFRTAPSADLWVSNGRSTTG